LSDLIRPIVGRTCAGTITISSVCCAHLYKAIALFVAGHAAAGSVGIATVERLGLPLVPFISRETLVGCLFLAGAGMALYAIHSRWLSHRAVVAMLLPQQTLLIITALGALTAVWSGHYPNGYAPDGGGWCVSTDQIWRILIAPIYTWALFARAMRHEHSIIWR
jgi:hypothetical protein